MSESRAEQEALLRKLRAYRAQVAANPLDYVAWLPGQLAWLSDPGPGPKLFRAGNRMGKTYAGCAEVIWRCLGVHPFNPNVRKAPVKCAFITSNKQAQGVKIQAVFWSLVPKHELVATDFNERTGFRGKNQVVQFRNGSTVTWYTNAAGPQSIQGGEYDYIQIDEPPSEALYLECLSRVRNTGGQVGITLTPLHLPVPWLRELCEEGRVSDHHYPLSLESQTSPLTGIVRKRTDGVPWDQAMIDAVRAEVSGPDAPIILDGCWETRSIGQWFDVFDEDKHTTKDFPAVEMEWMLGIDYARADRELGLCAVLTGVERRMEPMIDGSEVEVPHIWVLDEVALPGTASMDFFSVQILEMLGRHSGLEWHDLDHAWGDNPVRARGIEASNTELMRYLAPRLRISNPRKLRPRLANVKEGAGASSRARRSKDVRSKWAYAQISKDRVHIHPRCEVLIKALLEYDYSDKHPLKDITDAWLYGIRTEWTVQTARKRLALLVG